jgi:hypothetical protein
MDAYRFELLNSLSSLKLGQFLIYSLCIIVYHCVSLCKCNGQTAISVLFLSLDLQGWCKGDFAELVIVTKFHQQQHFLLHLRATYVVYLTQKAMTHV